MRNLLFGAALAVAAMTGCSSSESKPAPTKAAEATFPTMTPDQVEQEITAKTVTPVDCNGGSTRKKLGVVPGAISVSDEETYAASELPADKGTKLVFYCADPG
jgi:hypothetical protein